MIISLDEMLDYMGIDYADDMCIRNIKRSIDTTEAYLTGAIGKDYPNEDARAKELALVIASDFYDNRSLQAPTGNTRKLVDDLILQLKLEKRLNANE